MSPNIRRSWKRASCTGFTLPEALTAMAILAIVSVFALPAMQVLVQNYRVKTASFETFLALNYARSEAIKRGTTVTIQPNEATWDGGWRIVDSTGQVVKIQPRMSGGVRITGPDSLVYEKDGRLPQAGTTAAFSVVMAQPHEGTQSRCVLVDLTGRPNTRMGGCP